MAEKQPSSTETKFVKGAAIGLISLAGLGLVSSAVGKKAMPYIYPEPPIPPVPTLQVIPEPPPVPRAPVSLTVAFDSSLSDIQKQLPEVVNATADFFENNAVLKPGDSATICSFVGTSDCQTFPYAQKAELVKATRAIKPDTFKRLGGDTYINPVVNDILSKQPNTPGSIAVVWTDGLDESLKVNRKPLPPNHMPVKIVLPRDRDIYNGKNTIKSLGLQPVDLLVARTSAQFGNVLAGFAQDLERKAEAKTLVAKGEANKKREAEVARAENQLKEDKEKHTHDLDARTKLIEKRNDQVATFQKVALGTSGGLFASAIGLFGLAAGIERRRRNRPKLRGWVLDLRGRLPQSHELSGTKATTLADIDASLPASIELKPAKIGILKSDGTGVQDGDKLSQDPKMDIRWYEEQPDAMLIRKLMAEKKGRK